MFLGNRKTFLVQKNPFFWKNLTEEENDSALTNCEEVAKELNNFFANAVKNPNIPKLWKLWFFGGKHWWSYFISYC